MKIKSTDIVGGGGGASYPPFTGNADKVLAVNATEDDVEWVAQTGGGGGGTLRVVTIANGTSITIDSTTTDLAKQANTQAAGTLTINAPTGTPTDGQKLMLRLSSTSVQTFSWNAIFDGSDDLTLPLVSSSGGKTDYCGFIYDSGAAKWQLIAKNFGF